nr:glycine cleavage system protein H [Desulfobacula sp.]
MNLSISQKPALDCLWTQAGVVPRKKCRQEFACTTCRFERILAGVCRRNELLRESGPSPEGRQAGFVYWTDRLLKMPVSRRPCIHHMKGHIGFKNCTRAYRCTDCEFEQYFHDQFKVHTVLKPVDFEDIHGFSLPRGYYLHPGHTWIKIEDQGMVRMGIDDFAGKLFGGFDGIRAPLMGKKLRQGKSALALAREDHEVSFVSPVNGIITEINSRVMRNPCLIKDDPYAGGWVFILYCPALKQDLKHLMFMDSSRKFMDETVNRLYAFLEEEAGIKAADGGWPGSDIYGNLPGPARERLVKKFMAPKPSPRRPEAPCSTGRTDRIYGPHPPVSGNSA